MRMHTWIAAVWVVGITSLAMGQVTGTVKYDGPAPKMTPVDMSAKPECAAQHKDQSVLDQSLTIGKDGGLKDVVISIVFEEGAPVPDPKNPNPKEAVLDQKGCQYVPHVLAMEKGGHILVKNSDPFMHNIVPHSDKNHVDPLSQANVNPGQALPALTEPDYFHIQCQVHIWMSAWVAVLDNPYFAVTDADGHFTLPTGLIPGDYKVHAWHEKFQDGQDGTVTVDAAGKGTVNFTFKP